MTFAFVLFRSVIKTVAVDFVITYKKLSSIVCVPKVSIKGILLTDCAARHERGGTKNIPWFASEPTLPPKP